jgi:ribosomal protein S18 acetylase RimI-like enzyme
VRTQVPYGHSLADVVAARGYEAWRHSLTMEIALDEPPPAAPEQPGLDVRTYRDEDADGLRAALNDAFAEDPFWDEVTPSRFREFFLSGRGFDPQLWLLAWDGSALAGFALNYAEHGSEFDLGWVGTLGVGKPWRRRGLGESLLRRSFAELHGRGKLRVGLGVDAQNVTGALRLYERVGMHRVRRSDNWRKDL